MKRDTGTSKHDARSVGVAGRLIGTWRLRSCVATAADGTVTYPYGREPVGHIIYTPDSFMAVSIMSGQPPRVASDDLLTGLTGTATPATPATPENDGFAYVSYIGRYEVTPALGADNDSESASVRGEVVHQLETCSFPNWVGTRQIRRFELAGDQLTLITPPLVRRGVRAIAQLVWQRV